MTKHPAHRPSSRDTRQLLAHLIEARKEYSLFLRGVANGLRQPDTTEKALLESRCAETLTAWRAAHEAWRLDTSLFSPHINKRNDN